MGPTPDDRPEKDIDPTKKPEEPDGRIPSESEPPAKPIGDDPGESPARPVGDKPTNPEDVEKVA